jgi:hypothetical protein
MAPSAGDLLIYASSELDIQKDSNRSKKVAPGLRLELNMVWQLKVSTVGPF